MNNEMGNSWIQTPRMQRFGAAAPKVQAAQGGAALWDAKGPGGSAPREYVYIYIYDYI